MTDTKVPIELSSTPGIVDNSTATAITINSAGASTFSGDVGIGTSSPSALMDVNSGGVTSYASPSLNLLRNHGAQAYQNLNGTQFYWNTSNGSGETDIVYGNLATSYLRFIQNNAGSFTQTMTLDASGNLGIGLSNPSDYYSNNLVVNGGFEGGITIVGAPNNTNYLSFADSTSGTSRYAGMIEYNHTADLMAFRTNSVQRMTLDSSGQLSLATVENKARMTIGLTGVAVAGDTDGATMGENAIVHLLDTNSAATNSTVMLLGGGAGATGQIKSGIGFSRESSANWGTQLRFYTHSTPTSNLDELKERMRLDSDGRCLFGTTDTTLYLNSGVPAGVLINGAGGEVQIASASTGLYVNRFSSSGTAIDLRSNGGVAGTIYVTTNAASYNTQSDYRLKEDDVPMTGATERVKALRPINFAWKVDGSRVDGFFAHEAQEVVPEAVHGSKDAMRDEEYEVTPAVEEVRDEDGNVTTEAVAAVMGTRSVPDYQGIDQSKLVPLLTAALQEAIAKIETLEARLETLEGA